MRGSTLRCACSLLPWFAAFTPVRSLPSPSSDDQDDFCGTAFCLNLTIPFPGEDIEFVVGSKGFSLHRKPYDTATQLFCPESHPKCTLRHKCEIGGVLSYVLDRSCHTSSPACQACTYDYHPQLYMEHYLPVELKGSRVLDCNNQTKSCVVDLASLAENGDPKLLFRFSKDLGQISNMSPEWQAMTENPEYERAREVRGVSAGDSVMIKSIEDDWVVVDIEEFIAKSRSESSLGLGKRYVFYWFNVVFLIAFALVLLTLAQSSRGGAMVLLQAVGDGSLMEAFGEMNWRGAWGAKRLSEDSLPLTEEQGPQEKPLADSLQNMVSVGDAEEARKRCLQFKLQLQGEALFVLWIQPFLGFFFYAVLVKHVSFLAPCLSLLLMVRNKRYEAWLLSRLNVINGDASLFEMDLRGYMRSMLAGDMEQFKEEFEPSWLLGVLENQDGTSDGIAIASAMLADEIVQPRWSASWAAVGQPWFGETVHLWHLLVLVLLAALISQSELIFGPCLESITDAATMGALGRRLQAAREISSAGGVGWLVKGARTKEEDGVYEFETASKEKVVACTTEHSITRIEVVECDIKAGGSIQFGLTPKGKSDDEVDDPSPFGENGAFVEATPKSSATEETGKGNNQFVECQAGIKFVKNAKFHTEEGEKQNTTKNSHYAKIVLTEGRVKVKVWKNTKVERFFRYAEKKSLLEGASQIFLQISTLMARNVDPWDASFPNGPFWHMTVSVLTSMATLSQKASKAIIECSTAWHITPWCVSRQSE